MRDSAEAFVTLNVASKTTGIPLFKLQRAAARGFIPTYRFYNRRILVRVSEVFAAVEGSRVGGDK
jgi:hypothetical protein